MQDVIWSSVKINLSMKLICLFYCAETSLFNGILLKFSFGVK